LAETIPAHVEAVKNIKNVAYGIQVDIYFFTPNDKEWRINVITR
jgi:hypothetical protein